MKKSHAIEREILDSIDDPLQLKLHIALSAKPGDPLQRLRWLIRAQERYNADPSQRNARLLRQSVERHLGRESAASFERMVSERRAALDG